MGRLFAQILESAGARDGHKFVQMTASEALRKGPDLFAAELTSLTGGKPGIGPQVQTILRRNMACEVQDPKAPDKWFPGKVQTVEKSKNEYNIEYSDGTVEEDVPRSRVRAAAENPEIGGVLFLDEAYDLDPTNQPSGRAILAEIMNAAEENRKTLTIILAGYQDDMEKKLYAFNSGMVSRFANVAFDDFSESELADIWRKNCKDKGWTCTEDVVRVVARRVNRSRGVKGFGNARSVRKLFEASESEAKRRFSSGTPSLTMEDVIGQIPSVASIPALARAVEQLENMTGLKSAKEAVREFISVAEANYRRELDGLPIDDIALNRIFFGNPGTGKV